MNDILDTLGICLTPFQYIMFKNILKYVVQTDTCKLKFTTSSGNSIVIIDEYKVYQFYLFIKTYYHVLKVCQMNIPGFVSYINHYDMYQVIIFERIQPILNIENNTVKCVNTIYLINDIFNTLLTLQNLKISHNDLTLDNIGYSSKSHHYLIYDFENVKFESYKSRDMYTFLKSIEFRIHT